MSTTATDLPADSTITILELPGQSALSAFRLTKLLDDLQKIDERVTRLCARFSYFVHLDGPLPEKERGRLDALLQRLRETADVLDDAIVARWDVEIVEAEA